MRALIKTAPGTGNLQVLDAEVPRPGAGEALVRVGPSGLCGTDLLLYDGVYRGRNRPCRRPSLSGTKHQAKS
jgi:L-iditol 2-dehydrogenase